MERELYSRYMPEGSSSENVSQSASLTPAEQLHDIIKKDPKTPYEGVEELLENQEPKVERAVEEKHTAGVGADDNPRETHQSRLGTATWKNKDNDQPVVVTGYLPPVGGRQYISIEGSSTGIPLDEIIFPDEAPEPGSPGEESTPPGDGGRRSEGRRNRRQGQLGDQNGEDEEGRGWGKIVNQLRKKGIEEGVEAQKFLLRTVVDVQSPQSGPYPGEFIEVLIQHPDVLNYVVNRIIAQPLAAEQSQYDLSFYGKNNLDAIVDLLSRQNPPSEMYTQVVSMRETVQLSHGMNREIVTGNNEGFLRAGLGMTPQKLEALQNVKGASTIMRLMEQELLKIMSNQKFMSDEAYDTMVGNKDREPGEVVVVRGGAIAKQLMLVREAVSVLPEFKGMEDWEVEWAMQAGKILMNISLRSAEQISLGTVPKGADRWRSFPQESVARIMDWMKLVGVRFDISSSRGGVELAEAVIEKYMESRKDFGYGGLELETVGGREIKDLETANIFGASGIFSSWRQEEIILKSAPIMISYGGKTYEEILPFISSVIGGGKKEIEVSFLGREKEKHEKLPPRIQSRINEAEIDLYRSAFLDGNNLKPEFTNALGVLLKNSELASDREGEHLHDIKHQIRAAIWRRVAEVNPLGIVPFLTDAKFPPGSEILFDDDSGQKVNLQTKLDSMSEEFKKQTSASDWNKLRKKLFIANEWRISRISRNQEIASENKRNPNAPQPLLAIDLKTFFAENAGVVIREPAAFEGGAPLEIEMRLSEWEINMLKDIKLVSNELAPQLSRVRFPFNPFMNDVDFKRVSYAEAGQEFYKRRMNDIASFNNAGGSFVKLMDNPGAASLEEVINVLTEVEAAMASPLSTTAAMEKIEPFFEAYLDKVEIGGDIKDKGRTGGIKKWLAKQNIYDFVMESRHKPVSRAQHWVGIHGIAMNERAMYNFIHELRGHGLITEEFEEKLKKKKGSTRFNLIFAFIRDLFPVFALGTVASLTKKVGSSK